MVDYIRYYLFLVTLRGHRDRIVAVFLFADVSRPFFTKLFLLRTRVRIFFFVKVFWRYS